MKYLHPLSLVIITAVTAATTAADRAQWKAPARAAGVKNPVTADAASLSTGKALFARECASCHGESGRGNGPDAADLSRQPPDFAAPPVAAQTDGELFWKITEGRKPMPRFARSLRDDQRWHLVNYIRSITARRGG
jgi:mono/diheme cytochrome c family protein